MRAIFLILFLMASWAVGAEPVPRELVGIGVTEHLNSNIDLNLAFKDENGQSVSLAKYFHQNRPVVLLLVYYGCPSLCSYFLTGVTDSLKHLQWSPGQQFELVTVSIDPSETNVLASQKKTSYLKHYGRVTASDGWHFLTGSQEQIKNLTAQVGFNYKYEADTKQFAHVPVMTILTPEGKVSRYLYGIDFKPMDLKLALNEASEGKIGTLVDRIQLFCYHYDPKTRKYSLYAMNAMRLAGGGTVVFMGTAFFVGLRRRRKEEKI